MPENINILCTRELDQLLIGKAAAKNIYLNTIPFIRTEVLESEEFIQQLSHLSPQKIKAVFTSAKAAESVALQTKKTIEWGIFCIGGVTKDTVKKHFGENAIAASAKNAHMLAEKIISTKNVSEVYFFCGDHRLSDLPEILLSQNILVHEIISYKTIQTPQLIEEDYHGVMFFSPSAVHSFFSMNTIHTNVVLFSIGDTTSTIIQSYCMNKVITSEWPGAENLLEMALHYFDSIKQE